ncbi:MAG: bifunctional phosphoglucose/phosphomannose isomerase [Candidatus Marsarchaeota archaeon]|nr:bifunctional phosphoglucose/phosphomannose isomerase [Candidatus Marsarchaeota archaeon]MCL5094773.1 bifunctional phosphoglucose/phosphomannose isomerase [Candidatus Marsarchaeota archaeon]
MEFLNQLLFLKEQIKFNKSLDFNKNEFENIVIAGMGGSGIIGKIFQEIYQDKPVYIIDDYHIPKFVSRKTFFVGISFSGNTEETISAVKEAEAKKAHVSVITSGGKLERHGDSKIIIPLNNIQPRAGIGYMLMPFLTGFGLASKEQISKTYKSLEKLDKSNQECRLHAIKIRKENKIPVIYGSDPFKAIAYRWKTQFNENAKIMSFSNYFPELNHNEILGIKNFNNKYYFFVFDSRESRIKKRIQITSKITNAKFNIIKYNSDILVENLFYLIHYGDYVTYHLSNLRKVDALDISLIEQLKKELQ